MPTAAASDEGTGTGTGVGDIVLPDFSWPEDLFDQQIGAEGHGHGEFDIDIGMFLNDFIGTGRSAVEILTGGVGGGGRFG
jgi:hypothetical protein